jgi:CHAT domain
MSWTIIVASSQADQLEQLISGAQEIAARIGAPGTKPVMALSVEDVQRKRSRNPATELLIVAASLPHRESSPDPQTEPGFNLVKFIGQDAEPPACILVSDSDRIDHYRAVQSMDRCEWLAVGCSTEYVEQCLQLARRLRIIPSDAATARKPNVPARSKGHGAAVLPVVLAPPTAADPPTANGFAKTRASPPGVARVQSPRARQRASAGEPYALIEVNLPSQAELATVSVDIRHPDVPFRTASKPLNLRTEQVQQLVEKSRNLKDPLSDGQWQAEYRALGQQIHELLRDTLFGKYYERASGAVGENVRVRFNLDLELFDGLWESIFEAPDFLMLKNTIIRRAIQDDTFPSQLNGSHDALNILVIKSDVPDDCTPEGPDDPFWKEYWDSLGGTLPELPHLDNEVMMLRELGEAGADTVPNIRVDVLSDPRGRARGWSLADELKDTLKQEGRRYDVVHFAGHALFAPSTEKEDGRGYLIFSGQPAPRAVTIETVAEWLAPTGVQLIYLSCCRSSAPAALEFARKNVPMTIGFNWNLDDKKAVDFATTFYDELLDNRLKVCAAFNKARRRLYQHYRGGDPIWASPVLIAQPMEWIQVEDVLRSTRRERRVQPRPPQGRTPPRTTIGVPSTLHAPVALHS